MGKGFLDSKRKKDNDATEADRTELLAVPSQSGVCSSQGQSPQTTNSHALEGFNCKNGGQAP